MSGVFGALAEFVATGQPCPPEVDDAATERFIDSVGVIFAGADERSATIVDDFAADQGASGPSTSLVSHRRLTPAMAALVNGVAAHSLDLDDATTVDLQGHVSAVLVPTALAVGEAMRSSGRALIDAYVLGLEVELALGRAMNPYLYETGFHPTSTLGVFGSAAVTSSLRGSGADVLVTAFGIAASMACGVKANFGTDTKHLHAGWAANNGIVSVDLAARGLTTNVAAYEAAQGFGPIFGGPDWDRTDPLIGLPPDAWSLTKPGVAVPKLWPCCRATHSSVEAAIEIRRRLDEVAVTDIERVTVAMHPRRLPHVDRPHPATGNDARFSVQFCVAVALLEGSPTSEHFGGDYLDSADVREAMTRVTVVADPDVGDAGGSEDDADLGARIEVMSGGQCHEYTVARPIGASDAAVPWAFTRSRATEAVERRVGSEAAGRLMAAVADISTLPDVSTIFSELAPPSGVADPYEGARWGALS